MLWTCGVNGEVVNYLNLHAAFQSFYIIHAVETMGPLMHDQLDANFS